MSPDAGVCWRECSTLPYFTHSNVGTTAPRPEGEKPSGQMCVPASAGRGSGPRTVTVPAVEDTRAATGGAHTRTALGAAPPPGSLNLERVDAAVRGCQLQPGLASRLSRRLESAVSSAPLNQRPFCDHQPSADDQSSNTIRLPPGDRCRLDLTAPPDGAEARKLPLGSRCVQSATGSPTPSCDPCRTKAQKDTVQGRGVQRRGADGERQGNHQERAMVRSRQ